MAVDFKEILLAPFKALNLIEDLGRRKILDEFLTNVTPYTESATRKFLEQITREINSKLNPQIQLRLNIENNNVSVEVITTNQSGQRGWVNSSMEDHNLSNVLLRMPESVKEQVKLAAKTTGLSLNKWAVFALQHSAKNLDRAAETLIKTHSDHKDPEPTKEGDSSTN